MPVGGAAASAACPAEPVSDPGWVNLAISARLIPWPSCCLFCEHDIAVQVTLAGLHETFSDAKDIMKWLGTCAKVIAAHNEAVQWSTPLGLPVVQPYRQMVSGRQGAGQLAETGMIGRCEGGGTGADVVLPGHLIGAAAGLGILCQMVDLALLPVQQES